MMNFNEIANNRYSCRAYDPTRAVEQEKLDRILESARLAPSACNGQPYHITVCKGEAAAKTVLDTVLNGIPYDIFDEFDTEYKCSCSRAAYADCSGSYVLHSSLHLLSTRFSHRPLNPFFRTFANLPSGIFPKSVPKNEFCFPKSIFSGTQKPLPHMGFLHFPKT